VLVFCDTCGETLNVNTYDDDPPRSGWARYKPCCGPALDSWRCPECHAQFPETQRLRGPRFVSPKILLDLIPIAESPVCVTEGPARVGHGVTKRRRRARPQRKLWLKSGRLSSGS